MDITGTVEKVIFKNSDNGYTVIELDAGNESFIAVGIMPLVGEGEQLEVSGEFSSHPTYGKQLNVESFESILPVDENSMLRYLSCGVVKGVRESTARAIIKRFGPDSFEIIENYPERLTEIKGITEARANRISASFRENIGIKTLILSFQRFGMTTSMAFKIHKKWGMRAYDMVRENPYVLCEIQGITFDRIDAIASKMEIDANSEFRIRAGINYVLLQNLNTNGHTFLPKLRLTDVAANTLSVSVERVAEVLEIMLEEQQLRYVAQIGNTDGIYLYWVYELEKNICNRIALDSALRPGYKGNFETDIRKAEDFLSIKFAENQRNAIRMSIENKIMILTGGPGTGKTTTLNGIIYMLEHKHISFALAAPTGRAAKRVTELTGKEAKTIHRLLEYGREVEKGELSFAKNRENPLKYDAIIVDESSMIDIRLFSALLDAMLPTSRLIMVGDSDQLPPVGPGCVFKDIIASGLVSTVSLDQIFRQAENSHIVTHAHEIINGQIPAIDNKSKDFFFIPASDPETLVEKVSELYCKRLPSAYGFSPTDDIQIICPTRKTASGSSFLNEIIRDRVNVPSPEKKEMKFRDTLFREGDKVMQIKNNYEAMFEREEDSEQCVYNGDIGIIEEIQPRDETLIVNFDGHRVIYSPENLEELELSYAITVHKSQGSEFKAVILPLLEGYDGLFTRNLLYTAVTRARNFIVVVGSRARIEQMVNNVTSVKRYSGLKYFLKEAAELQTECQM